jgi:hypothetical protein
MLKEHLSEIYNGVQDPQKLRELASASLESRKLPDTYVFHIYDNKLRSSLTGNPIDQAILRSSEIDKAEYQAFVDIQNWALNREDGLVFWLSPPHPERSLQGKIIISKIEKDAGLKILTNRSILFDTNTDNCIEIANQIQNAFLNNGAAFLSDHELRRYPIFVNEDVGLEEWLPIIENIIAEQEQWKMVAEGEDIAEVERTVEWARQFSGGNYEANNYIGSNQLSCPLTGAFAEIQKSALEGKFVKRCGKCGVVIKKVIWKGYVCGICRGVYEGC